MTTPTTGKTFPAELLTPAEVQALIAACSPTSRSGSRNRALLTLLYRSGLRISEAIGDPGDPSRRSRCRAARRSRRPGIPSHRSGWRT